MPRGRVKEGSSTGISRIYASATHSAPAARSRIGLRNGEDEMKADAPLNRVKAGAIKTLRWETGEFMRPFRAENSWWCLSEK